jgi:type II secretory pathway component PulF
MALYSYQAFSKDGKKISGTVDAPTLATAREQLAKMGVYPIKIALTTEGAAFSLAGLFRRTVTTKEKILFTKQLAVLLRSGVPLLESLDLLIDQFEGRMKSILISIKDGLREGQSLAEGLGRYPKIFDTIFVQLVRAGEATGKLEIILERLTAYLERREQIAKRIKAALSYPMFQLAIIGLVVVFLMTAVIPSLASQFQRSGKALPVTTEILMNISDLLINHYIIILIIIVSIVLAFRYWLSTAAGSKIMDTIKLKIPIIKFFARTGAIVQFSRTLGTLIEGGVNLAEALDIVVKIIDNQILASSLKEARENIIKQGKIAQFLKQTGIFPPIAIHLIKTGEETGKLDAMLLTVAENYETELDEYVNTLSSLLDPIMLLVMGVIVGFIILSIAQPLMQQATLVAI